MACGLVVVLAACNDGVYDAVEEVVAEIVLGSGDNTLTIDPDIIAPEKLQALLEKHDIDPAMVTRAAVGQDMEITLTMFHPAPDTAHYEINDAAWLDLYSPHAYPNYLVSPTGSAGPFAIVATPLFITPDNKALLAFSIYATDNKRVTITNSVNWDTSFYTNLSGYYFNDMVPLAPLLPNGNRTYFHISVR